MIEFVAILLATYMAAVADTAFAPALAVFHVTPCLLPLVVIVATRRSRRLAVARRCRWPLSDWPLISIRGGHAGVGMASFALVAFAVGQLRGALRRLEPTRASAGFAPLVAAMLSS